MPIMPVTDTANRASWENSRGGRQQTSSAHPRGTGKAILWIVGSAAALLALGAFVWSSRRAPAPSVTPVLSAAAEIAPAPARPAAETIPTAASPSSAPVTAAAGKDAASAASDESAKPTAEATQPIEAPTAAQPAPEWRNRRSAPPATPAPVPAATGKGLTDFGGRR